MADLIKTINGLEFCKAHGRFGGRDCFGHYEKVGESIERVDDYRKSCPYGNCETGCVITLATDAIELLKEQRDVVRCKDCKFGQMTPVSYPQYWCPRKNNYMDENYFCFDGKRKDVET